MLGKIGGLSVALALSIATAGAGRAEDPPQPAPKPHEPKAESTTAPISEQEAQAQAKKTNFARGGYFIAFMGMWAIENSPIVGGEGQFFNSWGLMLRTGARHNRWFASELHVQYVNRFPVLGDPDAFLAWGMSANERFYFTRSRIQPFILGGIGFLQLIGTDESFRNSSPGFSVKGGFGVEIYANERVGFVIEAMYNYTVANIRNRDFVTVGAGFQFF